MSRCQQQNKTFVLLIKNKLTKVNTTIQWVKKIMKASAYYANQASHRARETFLWEFIHKLHNYLGQVNSRLQNSIIPQ